MTDKKAGRWVFARVPDYSTFTGDKRVWTTPRRKEFVCFAMNLDTLEGMGFKATTLPECKAAADHFAQKFEFPER